MRLSISATFINYVFLMLISEYIEIVEILIRDSTYFHSNLSFDTNYFISQAQIFSFG